MKITNVGGKIILSSKGAFTMHSKENITFTSTKKITETAKEGIFYGDYNEEYIASVNSLPIHCAIHFRPHKSWKGEYGFDWIRMGYKETSFEGDITYRNLIKKSLGASTHAQAYNKLKDTYDKSRKYLPWSLKKEDGGDVLDENKKPVLDEYCSSWLMLFPEQIRDEKTGEWKASGYENTEATLSMIVDNQTEAIKKYRLEYNKELFEISHSEIPTTKGLYKDLTFKVKCLKPFEKPQEIRIIGLEEGDNTPESIPHRNIVGKLKLLDNAFIYQPKIVLVKVTSNFEEVKDTRTGEPVNAPKPEIMKYLKQALILSQEIVWDELDITLDKEELYYGSVGSTSNKIKRRVQFLKYKGMVDEEARIQHDSQYLQNDLLLAFFYDIESRNVRKSKKDKDYLDYTDHFKIFYIDEATMADVGLGVAQGMANSTKNGKSCIVFREGLEDKDTAIHELLHAMGLRHSFSPNNLFMFDEKRTDNIMDYNGLKLTANGKERDGLEKLQLWKWQVDIIRENAKNNKFILKP